MVRTTPNRLIWIGALLISSFAPDRRKLAGKYAHKPSLQRTRFLAVIAACAALAAPLCRAQALYSPGASAIALDQLADSHSPRLLEAIERAFPEKAVELGRVWIGERHDFFFAVRVSSKPMLLIDDVPGPEMQNVRGTNLWYAHAHIERLGALHSFYYKVDGEKFGGSLNMPAFGDLSYPMPGVKAGTFSAKQTIVSKIFPGMKSDYWIYVPAGYDPHVPAALMVFQDGGLALSRDSGIRLLAVVDNLVAQRMVPYMICIFVSPGTTEGSENPNAMRSMLYDTVSDRYPRFLRDELLAEVSTQYSIRKDGYSHAIVVFHPEGMVLSTRHGNFLKPSAGLSQASAVTRVFSGNNPQISQRVDRIIRTKCFTNHTTILGYGCRMVRTIWNWPRTAAGRSAMFVWRTP
jgi:hypothetical protein